MDYHEDKSRYWLTEEPETASTERNVFRYYADAERLQVSLPDYTAYGRETRRGKTVGIYIPALTREAKELIRRALRL